MTEGTVETLGFSRSLNHWMTLAKVATDPVDWPEPTREQIEDLMARVLLRCTDPHGELTYHIEWVRERGTRDPGGRLAFFINVAAQAITAPPKSGATTLSRTEGFLALLPVIRDVLGATPPDKGDVHDRE